VSEEQVALQENPTLWQRIKGGAKSAIRGVIDYLPRGIMIIGGLYAGSALLESTMGIGGLGITKLDAAGLLNRGLMHLAVGSVIVGGYNGIKGAISPEHDDTVAPAPAASGPAPKEKQEKGLGQHISEGITEHAAGFAKTAMADAIAPGSGLPMTIAKLTTKATGR
jgi:hypothetical protein